MVAPRVSLALPGTANQCNAYRRALMTNVPMLAPVRVNIRRNTTVQTDEYIAQRIGLIPFAQDTAETARAVLNVVDRDAVTSDFRGAKAAYPDIVVATLGPGQALDLDVEFARDTGASHAQYVRTCAVAMQPSTARGVHEVSFTPLIAGDAPACVVAAWEALCAVVDEAIVCVEASEEGGSG